MASSPLDIPNAFEGRALLPTTGADSAANASAQNDGLNTVELCASCDRCRSRKTKCDGKRPCGNCAGRYMRTNGVSNIEGVDFALFDCVYSPAKRRGPIPGRSTQRRAMNAFEAQMAGFNAAQQLQLMLMQQQLAASTGMMMMMNSGGLGINGMGMMNTQNNPCLPGVTSENKYGSLQSQLLMQQQLALMRSFKNSSGDNQINGTQFGGIGAAQQPNLLQQSEEQSNSSDRNQRVKVDTPVDSNPRETIHTVSKHLPLLQKSSMDGNRFRSYYDLSFDQLLRLPPIPTNNEYMSWLKSSPEPNFLPKLFITPLYAARFAEIALGALVNNQVALALELSNATVHCLRMCAEEPVRHPPCIFELARAYLLHSFFLSYRSDFVRYFKYRRVCLVHISKLDNDKRAESLLSAISFHDSWAYLIHNASETNLPTIDDILPPITPPLLESPLRGEKSSVEMKYGISTIPSKIAMNPVNRIWIQGPPPVFINNEASPICRSLDALACVVRSCCDQANERIEGLTREIYDSAKKSDDECFPKSKALSHTRSAVLANENELYGRNIIISAFTMLQQHEASSSAVTKNHGHHLILSAMDAFFEGGDEDERSGFTDSQIHSLLSVCNTAVEHPFLLYQPGPTYHMITNATILLCHLLNGMYANRTAGGNANSSIPVDIESALFDEALDAFIAIRKLLNAHRNKLPVRLRCHCIPRPNIVGSNVSTLDPAASFIDLGETLMCASRACQGFVLLACSPCVAAERIKAASAKIEEEAAKVRAIMRREAIDDPDDFDQESENLNTEFDVDDDALLSVLSRNIQL